MVLFREISISGKGQALVASCDIPKGTRVLSEKFIFKLPQRGISEADMNELIATKLSHCSKDEQRAFLQLYNSHKGSTRIGPFLGIGKTNALPLGTDASEVGIFLIASRINHACLPNCQHTWNERLEQETIHAVRNIAKDEEITISYSDTGPSQTRRERL